MDELREEFPSFNFYTMDQLVCLSSAIAELVFAPHRPLPLQGQMLVKFACGNSVNMNELEKRLRKRHHELQKSSNQSECGKKDHLTIHA